MNEYNTKIKYYFATREDFFVDGYQYFIVCFPSVTTATAGVLSWS